MEWLIIFFLISSGNGEDLKERLNSFLAFYRENRELIATLAGMLGGTQTAQQTRKEPEQSETEKPEAQKNGPDEGPHTDILGQFLKNRIV